ncbi:hypothetical protein [Streptomyces xiamenensis]|uniref:hypothetical protein n=1 Tax=Streptomyces xiamenensis TaxID=408015 RepID=UPI0037D5FFCB
MSVLGCAQEYRAVIHWRGGGRPYTSPAISSLTSVSWSRSLNDISEASITVAKSGAGPECCAQLGAIHPWVHELTIYRDRDLVWQGPVSAVVESRDSIRIDALDVIAWLGRTVNTTLLRYVTANADAGGRRRGPVQWIAEHIIRTNLTSALSVPPDYPGMLNYIVRQDGPTTRFEMDGESNSAVWSAYLLTVMEELAKRGLEYTTVGRTLLLRGPADETTPAQARLGLADIAGDVEVIRDGASAATHGWATTQRANQIDDGRTAGWGATGTPYGRLDWLVTSEADTEDAELLDMAKEARRGRYPAPTGISIPSGSRLAATAPVTMQQLVAGERIDVSTASYCMETVQAFRVGDVEVSWGNSGEQVAVSLVPATSLGGE